MMKKPFVLLLLWVVITYTAHAQIYIIPKVGATFTTIRFTENENVGGRFGYVGGLAANFPLDPDRFLSIQPELLYIQKGSKLSQIPVYNTQEFILNYLETPILVKISFNSQPLKAYVNAGPSVAYTLDGINKKGENNLDIKFGNEEGTDFKNRIDLGLQFGGGVGLQVGLGEIQLDIRYGLGLSNLYLNDKDTVTQTGSHTARNSAFALTLGYAILLGGN